MLEATHDEATGGTAVFVQHRDFFGAMVEHVPLLHSLRMSESGSRIVVYAPFARARMFEALGLADQVRIYPRAGRKLLSELRAAAFDRIVSLRPKSLGLTALIGASRARRRIGYSTALSRLVFTRTIPRVVSIYRARNYLNLLEGEMRVPAIDECVRWLAARATERAQPTPRPWCLIPCGSEERKLWGRDNFTELALRIAAEDRDARFVLVLGGNERHYVDHFASVGLGQRTHALVDGDLRDIARVVLDSRAVISNDCGPGHVAQLSRVPQVSIFGNWDGAASPRIAEWFHPRPGAVSITTADAADITSIQVESVLAAARESCARPDAPARIVHVPASATVRAVRLP